jgi:hypothetical protein
VISNPIDLFGLQARRERERERGGGQLSSLLIHSVLVYGRRGAVEVTLGSLACGQTGPPLVGRLREEWCLFSMF